MVLVGISCLSASVQATTLGCDVRRARLLALLLRTQAAEGKVKESLFRTSTSRRITLDITIMGLMFSCFVSRVQGTVSDPVVLRFDAKWWQRAYSNEQQGFI